MSRVSTTFLTSGNSLTKKEVHDYYMDPVIQQRILAALAGRDLVAIMSRSPTRQILKRYRKKNEPIRIDSKKDLDYYASRRYTEFHPTVGNQTQEVWVDIDPGKNITTEHLKPVAKEIAKSVQTLPDVRDTAISFSGGRGFHVRGFLDKPRNTAKIQAQLKTMLMEKVRQRPAFTLSQPEAKQIRLDVSTFHNKGSLRAPFSLNTETGLVALPLKNKELKDFDPKKDATPEAVLKRKEFARGIPLERTIQPIPEESDKHWTLAVQEHNAKKAGKHFDLRLVDPRTGFAHSWAIPKTRFPVQGDRPILAIQTPTHTAEYALQFGAGKTRTIGKGYGAGKVRIVEKDPVKIIAAKPNSIKFEKNTGETYHLFRTKDTTWLLRNITGTKEGADMSEAFDTGYRLMMEKFAARRQMGMEGTPRISEMHKPMENVDQGSPADSLAMMLQEIPELQNKNRAKSTDLGIQRRLNRRTGWSGPHSMQGEQIQGASPIMVGRW